MDAAPPDAGVPLVAVCRDGSAPHATIQGAIDAAPAGAWILVCAGTYLENLLVEKPLTIVAEHTHAVIVDGRELGPALLARDVTGGEVTVQGLALVNGLGGARCEGSTLVLRQVRLERNEAEQGGGASYSDCGGVIEDAVVTANEAVDGGGVAIIGGDARLVGGEVSGNHATTHGGGVYLANDGGVFGTTIRGNSSANKGGGLFVDAHAPVIADAIIEENTSFADGGGAVVAQSSAELRDTVFTANVSTVDDAGALRVHGSTVRVERCRFVGNRAGNDGGAIKVSHDESVFVDLDLEHNEAGGNGGGIELDDDHSTIERSRFRFNRATRGGAIHGQFMGWGGGLFDSVIEDNEASERGGGVALENNLGDVTIARVVFRRNRAERGGAISASATILFLRSSIVGQGNAEVSGGGIYLSSGANATVAFVVLADNDASVASALRVAGLLTTVSVSNSILAGNSDEAVRIDHPIGWTWNDVWPGGAGVFAGMSDPTGESGNLSVDPLFADDEHHLAPGSPLIDAGDPAIADVDGTRADMGAYGGPGAP